MDNLKVRIRHEPDFDGTSIWIYGYNDVGMYMVKPISLIIEEHKLGTLYPEPTLRFDRHEGEGFLSALANALAEAGYHPNELKAKDREMAAVRAHLTDMQRLVFEDAQRRK